MLLGSIPQLLLQGWGTTRIHSLKWRMLLHPNLFCLSPQPKKPRMEHWRLVFKEPLHPDLKNHEKSL